MARESSNVKMIFARNDNRFIHLENELKSLVNDFAMVDYDPIYLFNKYLAALFTYNKNKKLWWMKYQWHPLIQKSRQKRIWRNISLLKNQFNTLLMVGSWFNPFCGVQSKTKFYTYIDQSCNKVADKNDMDHASLQKPRIQFNLKQYSTYKRCSKIFCMSDWAKGQILESHPIETNKIFKVGWGPIGLNLLNDNVDVNTKSQNVLFIGHEFYRKGVDLLRQSLPKVIREIPNVKYKIVGANTDNLKLEPHKNFELIGHIKDPIKIRNLYLSSSIFVLPHRFDRSPHVLIEAMSAGLPIITSNQGAAPEVVKEGINGFIIDVEDVNQLSEYIIKLLKYPKLCQEFGIISRQIVMEEYTWKAIAKKIIKHIEND